MGGLTSGFLIACECLLLCVWCLFKRSGKKKKKLILEYLRQSSFPTVKSPAKSEREKGAESELKGKERKCITTERNLEELL